jgi:hypothetical protein
MSALKYNSLMITDAVKSDLESLHTESLSNLSWEEHSAVQLKGVPEPQTLWELQGFGYYSGH